MKGFTMSQRSICLEEVNSFVRAFKDMDRVPLMIKKGKGVPMYDEDDNEYIDYVCV